MSIIGRWELGSIRMLDENGVEKYVTPDEYLNSPMPPYRTTESDIKNEMKQRKMTVDTVLSVEDDGKIYSLMPVPEGISKEQLDMAVNAGAVKLKNGLMLIDSYEWKEENGVYIFDSKIQGEALGEKVSPWIQLLDDEGCINMIGMRFVKVD